MQSNRSNRKLYTPAADHPLASNHRGAMYPHSAAAKARDGRWSRTHSPRAVLLV